MDGVTEILLVQSEAAAGTRLRTALGPRSEPESISEVPNPRAAVKAAKQLRPDIVVLSVELNDVIENGVMGQLRGVAPTARIVMHANDASTVAPGSTQWLSRMVDAVADKRNPPTLEARLELPGDPSSVPLARDAVTQLLRQGQTEAFVDSAALLATELVANAVRHVPGPCALELTRRGSLLRMAVVDSGPGTPSLENLGTLAFGGRGMHIVSSLSTAWGVDHFEAGGKAVWAELETPAEASPAIAPQTTSQREIAQAQAAEADLRVLLANVLERLEVDVVTVLRFDAASDHLVTMLTVSEHSVSIGQHRVPVGRGLAGRVAETRTATTLEDISNDDLLNPVLYELGVRSVLALPLLASERLLGVLKVGSCRPRRFSADDMERAEALAIEVIGGLDAHDAAEERSAATALQRSLVPQKLPLLDGLQLAGRYVPGEGGVSGDWYDVFELPDGSVGMVMGDVAGHGLAASVVMGRLRSALRAYALECHDPAEVLRRLDAKIFHFEPGAMATAIYAVTQPPFDEVRIASAGHFLPILAEPGRVPTQVDIPVSLPLGVEPTCERTSAPVQFGDDSTLVLFTDGLIERRSTSTTRGADVFASIDSALAELSRAIRPGAADKVCSRILDSMLTIEPPGDDVALLVVRRR
jgi:putative methionine-R-sulfoxide reductase with GAF domain/anti-sigma regulatory factor (Ser/Thr protein kinase)